MSTPDILIVTIAYVMITPKETTDKAVDIVTNANMPYSDMTSREWMNKLKMGEI